MKKPLFSEQKLPMLLTSISDSDASKTICTIRNAIYDGTQGFLLHMEKLKQEWINLESLSKIIAFTGNRPLYTMNYRRKNGEKSDEKLIAEQLLAVQAGASMIDMMGDMFDPSPLEISLNPTAIRKQMQVVDQVHELGGEVLMSSHTWVYMTTEEVLAHTKKLQDRGADFIKIAMCVNNKEQAIEANKTTAVVSNELKVPFLHICMGQYGKLHRAIGPLLGSCFALCVYQYTESGHKDKPLLRAEKAVFDNIDYMLARDSDIESVLRAKTESGEK
jgi:3-dehydroquinate dehydratase